MVHDYCISFLGTGAGERDRFYGGTVAFTLQIWIGNATGWRLAGLKVQSNPESLFTKLSQFAWKPACASCLLSLIIHNRRYDGRFRDHHQRKIRAKWMACNQAA
jgi:hypothetical protein